MRYLLLPLIILFVFGCSNSPEPKSIVTIEPLQLAADKYEVTVAAFRQFIQETDYTTTADSLGWSGFFNPQNHAWETASFANWEKPNGVDVALDNEPVTQVSYTDACAFCDWVGGRLPSAKEWNQIAGKEVVLGNTWEGNFPINDTGLDGYRMHVSPVGFYKPNKHGVYDLFGNVWEWTSTKGTEIRGNYVQTNGTQLTDQGGYLIKGGSYLCAENYCAGYNPNSYQVTPANTGTNHLGFRCVYDLK